MTGALQPLREISPRAHSTPGAGAAGSRAVERLAGIADWHPYGARLRLCLARRLRIDLSRAGFQPQKIAFLAIFVLWLGLYDVSKISMASFNAIFSVVVATMAAADGVDRELYWPARNLGAASGSCCVRSSCRRHRRDHDPAGGTPDLGS
jgi:hypothetical protein